MTINTETVTEIAQQLSNLYGHAISDILPIVLNAISLIFFAKLAAGVLIGIVTLVIVFTMVSWVLKLSKQADEEFAEKFNILKDRHDKSVELYKKDKEEGVKGYISRPDEFNPYMKRDSYCKCEASAMIVIGGCIALLVSFPLIWKSVHALLYACSPHTYIVAKILGTM